MVTNSLIHQITLGREGKNWGYSMGLPKLEGIVDGVLKNSLGGGVDDLPTGKIEQAVTEIAGGILVKTEIDSRHRDGDPAQVGGKMGLR